MGDATKAKQKLGWSPTVTFQVKINISLKNKTNVYFLIDFMILGVSEGHDVS